MVSQVGGLVWRTPPNTLNCGTPASKKDEWVASWRTICPGEVRMFDPVGTEEKHGFDGLGL